jgi:hypothetical protein
MAKKKTHELPPAELDKLRARDAERKRKQRNLTKEIAPLPACADPKLREQLLTDLEAFLLTCFPTAFPLPFSPAHKILVTRLQDVFTRGGLQAIAMPRGFGKTTIVLRAALWAVLYGHQPYVALLGANATAADELLDTIRTLLETNETLLALFPEVCYPIRCLEGETKKAIGQTLNGERTRIGYKGKRIILPTVPGSKSSGSIIQAGGLLSRLRGFQFTREDGVVLRPTCVIPDDPQTDSSAASDKQSDKRWRVMMGAVLGLAGPGVRICGVCPCTVIRYGYMSWRLLQRQLSPEWQGTVTKLVVKWSKEQELIDEYAELRKSDLMLGDDNITRATAFWRKHQKTIESDTDVTWKERFDPYEVSALQHAYNLKFRNPLTFDAEYQSDPQEGIDLSTGVYAASSDSIAIRASGYERGVVPKECVHLVAGVDVQRTVLYWTVLAVAPGFTSYVVDYGVWPEQGKIYFGLSEADRTIQHETGVSSLSASILAGLRRFESFMLSREYIRDDGTPMNLERIVLDANDGPLTDTIYSFVRQTQQRAIWLPWHGMGITASKKPMNQWPVKQGEIIGDNWRINPTQAQNQRPRHIVADSNHWKTFTHARLRQPDGEPGALMLFKASPAQHRMYADHIAAWTPIETTGQGRKLVEWKLNTGAEDHYGDSLVMACVAGSVVGGRLREHEIRQAVKPERKTLAQMRDEAKKRRSK